MWNIILPSIFRLEVDCVLDSPGSLLLGFPSLPWPGKNHCLCIFGVEGHLIFGFGSLWFHGESAAFVECMYGGGGFMEKLWNIFWYSNPFRNSLLLCCLGSFMGVGEHVFWWPSCPFERGSLWIVWRTAPKSKEYGFASVSVSPWATQLLCTLFPHQWNRSS